VALLEIADLSLSFSGLRALADVSFDMNAGEIVGLIGPNGAGKSTLLNCVSRLYRPEHGTIRFEGQDLLGRTAHEVAALGIRRTFQNLELFREASVRENVTLGLAYRYKSSLLSDLLDLPSARAMRRAAQEEANRIIDSCRLAEVADVPVSGLPYGLQKSVELARALAGRPKLLLLDEPAAGMNPEESRRVAETVRHLRRWRGHHRPADRARHARGHDGVRPRRRARPRRENRRRIAGRGQALSRGDQGLSGRRVRACLRSRICPQNMEPSPRSRMSHSR
jgi:branched-chain amino acid transport system ATP-binding protein